MTAKQPAFLNRIAISGLLARALHSKQTPDGAVGTLELQVTQISKARSGRVQEKTHVVEVTLPARQLKHAETLPLVKGCAVRIVGKLFFDTWLDAQGKEHEQLKILGHEVWLLSRAPLARETRKGVLRC